MHPRFNVEIRFKSLRFFDRRFLKIHLYDEKSLFIVLKKKMFQNLFMKKIYVIKEILIRLMTYYLPSTQ